MTAIRDEIPEVPPRGAVLRQRRRERLASYIELAALQLFAERGFDDVTVDDIAEAADISRRTFFRYFSSKADVLLSDSRRRGQEVREALESRPPDEPAVIALRMALLTMAEGIERDRDLMLLRAEIARKADGDVVASGWQEMAEMTEGAVNAVADRMGLDPSSDLRPALIVGALSTAGQVASWAWIERGAKGSLTALIAEAIDIYEAGLDSIS